MDALPDELLLQIFETVSEQLWRGKWNTLHRTRNLHRLSLVSRRFNRVVTPMLYEHIRGPPFLTSPFWIQIAGTLYQNYAVAQLIQTLSMTKRPPGISYGSPKLLRSESLLLLLPILSCYNSFTLADLILYLERRFRQGDNVLATFIVLQAPALVKLELLGFENDGYHNPRQIPLVVEELGCMIIKDLSAGVGPQCFRSLRSLRIDLWDWGYFPPTAMIPFMYLRQLKCLILEGWGLQSERARHRGFKAFGSGKDWPARTSSVQELMLEPGYGSAFQHNNLILACTALKSFQCTARISGTRKLERWYATVSESLLAHASTLESVIMGDTQSHYNPLPKPFQHTARWTSLKMLQIPYKLLVGDNPRRNITECLPPSLEYLVLFSTHQALAAMGTKIDNFVVETSSAIYGSYVDGFLPCLKGVELTLDWSYSAIQTVEHKIPRPDVQHTISAFQDLQITLCVSMYASYQNKPPPTKDDMRGLKTIFPGITSWCKGHRILRLSTCTKPCVPGYRYAGDWGSGPYGWIWKDWDFENDSEPTVPE